MNRHALSVVIAGGGTGGHLSPGIAIGQEFMARNPNNRILFIGTGRPLEVTMLSTVGFQHKTITTEGIKGRGLLQQIASLFKVPKGVVESIRILRGFRPGIVIGVGSYAAGPVGLAAWLLRINIVLHEQNVQPGMTNRILARFAQRIYVSFEETKARLGRNNSLFTGNPVRSEFLNSTTDVDRFDHGQKRPFRIVITGGSQGAHAINAAVMDAIAHIKDTEMFYFVHQTGPEDEKIVKEAYQRHGMSSTVKPFFKDMANQYRMADLMICRAGALTVAEVTALGKAVIFIPYPFHTDNHQVLNARVLKDAGAADMILQDALSGQTLMEKIEYYAANPQVLKQMGLKAAQSGKTDAAAIIVDDCYRLVRMTDW